METKSVHNILGLKKSKLSDKRKRLQRKKIYVKDKGALNLVIFFFAAIGVQAVWKIFQQKCNFLSRSSNFRYW